MARLLASELRRSPDSRLSSIRRRRAPNTTLDPADPNYAWIYRGEVLSSGPADNFNALDPNITNERYSLAAGPSSSPHAVEAPFLIRHGNYYYLFV